MQCLLRRNIDVGAFNHLIVNKVLSLNASRLIYFINDRRMIMKRVKDGSLLFTLTHPCETSYMKEMEAYFDSMYFAN